MCSLLRNITLKSSILREGRSLLWAAECNLHTTALNEAARKGTREKARKKKVKVEVQKVGFIPHNQREKKIDLQRANLHLDDTWKQVPVDNCYFIKYHRWPVYTIQEAIKCHRETHHPTMLNEPKAPLLAHIELNMVAEKTTRFLDNFNRMAKIPHRYDHGEDRRILVFTKGEEELAAAQETGATLAGGAELIKKVTNGELLLAEYQYIIAHPNILPELVTLRGLLKRRFPSTKLDTLGVNLPEMIKRYADGISYKAIKDEYQQDFGLITVNLGPLDMDGQHLEENLIAVLHDVDSMRPKRSGKFITRVLLKCPPSREVLKIDPFLYVNENYEKQTKSDENLQKEEDQNEQQQSPEKVAALSAQ